MKIEIEKIDNGYILTAKEFIYCDIHQYYKNDDDLKNRIEGIINSYILESNENETCNN